MLYYNNNTIGNHEKLKAVPTPMLTPGELANECEHLRAENARLIKALARHVQRGAQQM